MTDKFLTKLLLVVLLCTSFLTYAQDEEKAIESNDSQKNAVTLYLGLPSIGVGYARQFSDHISLRGKLGFFSYNIDRKNMELSGRTVDLNGNFTNNTFDLLLDYNPFKQSSFKLVAGISYLTKTKYDAVITPAKDQFKYGEIVLSKDQVGDITTGADWSGVAPYLGIGFGRAVPKRSFGFGFEVGSYFTGKPDVTFQASGLLTPTEAAEKQEFTDWMQKYTMIPNLTLHVNYKF